MGYGWAYILENSLVVSQRVKYKTVIRPSNSTHSVPNQEKEKHSLHKDLHANVQSSIIQIPPQKAKHWKKPVYLSRQQN